MKKMQTYCEMMWSLLKVTVSEIDVKIFKQKYM